MKIPSALRIAGGNVLPILLLFCAAAPVHAGGRIVVANDEWTLSHHGATPPSQPHVFIRNVARWFVGDTAGRFLAYSDNLGVLRTDLIQVLADDGHQLEVSTRVPFTLDALLRYDALFLGGYPADQNILIDYLHSGGNVYVFAGTGTTGRFASSADEAERWNRFLGAFGLAYASEYNRVSGHMPIAETHSILASVDALFQNNGQSVIDLDPGDPRNRVIAFYGEQGLYAIYDPVRSAGLGGAGGLGARWELCDGGVGMCISGLRQVPALVIGW